MRVWNQIGILSFSLMALVGMRRGASVSDVLETKAARTCGCWAPGTRSCILQLQQLLLRDFWFLVRSASPPFRAAPRRPHNDTQLGLCYHAESLCCWDSFIIVLRKFKISPLWVSSRIVARKMITVITFSSFIHYRYTVHLRKDHTDRNDCRNIYLFFR